MDDEFQGVTPAQAAEPAGPAPASDEQAPAQPSPDDTATQEQDGQEPAAPDNTGEEEPQQPKGVQKRIDELTRRFRDEQRRAEHLQAMLDRALNQGPRPDQTPGEPQQPAFQPTRPKPKLEDYQFDQEAFTDALTDWKLEQVQVKTAQEAQLRHQQTAQAQFQRDFDAKKDAVREAGTTKYNDFMDVMETMVIDEWSAMALLQATENPHDVAYYLGKSAPKELTRIQSLPPLARAAEFAKIEVRMKTAPPKKTTEAPPPIKPVGGVAPGSVDTVKLARDDPAKWIEMRNRGEI